MGSSTLQTLQDPILLTPWVCIRTRDTAERQGSWGLTDTLGVSTAVIPGGSSAAEPSPEPLAPEKRALRDLASVEVGVWRGLGGVWEGSCGPHAVTHVARLEAARGTTVEQVSAGLLGRIGAPAVSASLPTRSAMVVER
jgi:hypothetical protein